MCTQPDRFPSSPSIDSNRQPRPRGAVACALAFTVASGAAAADLALPPTFHDWGLRQGFVPGAPIVPIPHPGWDVPIATGWYTPIYQEILNAGVAVGLMLQPGTAPITGFKDPNALLTMMDTLPRVDLVFSDFETATSQIDNYWMCVYVRTHPNPQVSSAWIGAYPEYPGEYDESQLTPSAAVRGFNSDWYLSIGLDIAMPNCYPYSDFQVHTWPSVWGSYLAPSVRAAMFWAPIERASVARLAMPSSHKLIPWIASFVQTGNYLPQEPPPIADNKVLPQHLRLRGCDGYYTLVSNTPGYTSEQYRVDAHVAWSALDAWFAGGPIEYLNLETDKVSGVQWSGISRPGFTGVVVSNLGNSDVTVTLPGGPWPYGAEVWVPKGTHQLHASDGSTPPPLTPGTQSPDLDGDGVVGPPDVGILLSNWGVCRGSPECVGDLNTDGVVNPIDLGIVLSAWQ